MNIEHIAPTFIAVYALVILALILVPIAFANKRVRRANSEYESYVKAHRQRGRYIYYLQKKLKMSGIKFDSESDWDPELEAFNQKMGDPA